MIVVSTYLNRLGRLANDVDDFSVVPNGPPFHLSKKVLGLWGHEIDYSGSTTVNGLAEGDGYALVENSKGDKITLEGFWLKGELSGYGTMKNSQSGEVYNGEWTNGQWHGEGEFQDKAGSNYTGSFANGSFHGNGFFERNCNSGERWSHDL